MLIKKKNCYPKILIPVADKDTGLCVCVCVCVCSMSPMRLADIWENSEDPKVKSRRLDYFLP